jgi:hypothetical protein
MLQFNFHELLLILYKIALHAHAVPVCSEETSTCRIAHSRLEEKRAEALPAVRVIDKPINKDPDSAAIR